MKNIFRRYFSFFAILLFLIPFTGAVIVLVGQANKSISFTENERIGLRYHQSLFHVLIAAQRYRGQTFIAENSGNAHFNLPKLKSALLTHIDSADALTEEVLALELSSNWQQTKLALHNAIEALPSEKPLAHFERQTSAITLLLDLMRDVGSRSYLVLDPELDYYHMMNVVVNILPDMTEDIGYLRGRVSAALVKGPISNQERRIILGTKNGLKDLVQRYRYSIGVIERNSFGDTPIENNTGSLAKLKSALILFQNIVEKQVSSLGPQEFFSKVSVSIDAFAQVYEAFAGNFEVKLDDRINELQKTHLHILIALFMVLAATIIIFLYFRRHIAIQDEVDAAQRTKAILGTVVDGIITINQYGIVETFNTSAECIFGYKKEEVIGRNVSMLMPEPYHSAHDGYLAHYNKTGEKRVIGIGREVVAKRKDNTEFPMELAISSFTSGDKTMFVGSIRDISDRVEAQKANQLLSSVVSSSADAIISKNINGMITSWSRGAVELFGYTEKEAIGQHITLIFPEDRLYEEDNIIRKLRNGESLKDFDTVRRAKDGSLIEVSLTIAPIRDAKGAVIGAAKVARDVRERKQAQEKLANFAEELEWKNAELENARELADHANRMKSEFLATMSHEIRTPMNGIIGMTELLLESNLTIRQQDYARTVMVSAESLLEIINDVLDFSKIESGKFELETIPFDLHAMFDETLELMAVKAREKAVELILRFAPDTSSQLVGDPTRVRQLIMNLIGNAIKFTEKGRVLVTVEELQDDDQESDHARIKVSVEDTGIGISQDAQGKLFDKFSQADSTTTRKYGGTGLGLAICKQLTEMMAGEIGLESEEGEGSTFWFTMTLPRHTEHIEAITKLPVDHLSNVHALVVDDMIDNITIVKEQLEAIGMDCTTCNDSTKAYQVMCDMHKAGKAVQLVLLDYLMPKMNGEMLAKQIKADDSPVKDTAIIMLTSAGGQGFAKRFAAVGISAYLSKPIHSRQLIETVSHVWQAWKAGNRKGLITAENIQTRVASEDQIRFDGAKVLLAEDNRINQGFAIEILESLGVDVDIAANGKEAISAVMKQPYDVIFMDCQMPEMNGFEASLELLNMKKHHKIDDIPIIALTANAMKGDRERCLGAGMNDYIAKPMRKSDLINSLTKWLPETLVHRLSAAQNVQNSAKRLFNNAHILLVEDNRVNREFVIEMLDSLGCTVTIAENGKISLQKIRNAPYDLVLMDVQMPEMDGLEATQHMREMMKENEIDHTPIIALTANVLKGDREVCLNAGMDDYLAKPVHKQTLVEALVKWVPEDKHLSIDDHVEKLPATQGKGEMSDHILVVEDNRTHQEYIKAILEQFGFNVTLVDNGQKALDAVKDVNFNLVLMDCDMPVMDGWQAASQMAQLRRDKEIADVPVIALTANQSEGDAERCFAAGFDEYIAKSIWRPKWQPNIRCIIEKWLTREHEKHSPSDIIDKVSFFEMYDILQSQFESYVKLSLEDIAFHINQIKHFAEASRDAKDVILSIHTIKSISDQLGAIQLTYISTKIEKHAADLIRSDAKAVPLLPLLSQMESVFGEAKSYLEYELSSLRNSSDMHILQSGTGG